MEEEKIRTDYEPIREGGSRVGFERGRIGRVKVTPEELASYNLYKVLEKYPEFTKEARSQIQKQYNNFEGLDTMNLEVFASVLTFLKNHPTPTPDDFKDEVILEYFSRILPVSSPDKKRIILRLKAQFLKYTIAITNFKRQQEEEFEEFEEEFEEEDVEEDQYEDEDYEDDE